jgi:hypothetical protein
MKNDRNGLCVYENQFLGKLCGRDASELLGEGWMRIIYEEDIKIVQDG